MHELVLCRRCGADCSTKPSLLSRLLYIRANLRKRHRAYGYPQVNLRKRRRAYGYLVLLVVSLVASLVPHVPVLRAIVGNLYWAFRHPGFRRLYTLPRETLSAEDKRKRKPPSREEQRRLDAEELSRLQDSSQPG